jgi:hypothetical protein
MPNHGGDHSQFYAGFPELCDRPGA